ncbi:MAG: hypothetical protein ABIO70_02340 [Pseudomonadota bacterium]
MDDDCDGEPTSHLWTVTSGGGSLRLANTSTPTLTVAGSTPEYTTTVREIVEVEVTDRVGDVGVDVVLATYECGGG